MDDWSTFANILMCRYDGPIIVPIHILVIEPVV